MWLLSVWLKAIQSFCLALVIQFPPKKISCQPVFSEAVLDSYFQPSGNHGSQVRTLRKCLPYYHIHLIISIKVKALLRLLLCGYVIRDPSSEMHRTKIVNGPSSTDMTSLCSPFLLHFLPLAFQAVAFWDNTIFFSQLSAYRSRNHYWGPYFNLLKLKLLIIIVCARQ